MTQIIPDIINIVIEAIFAILGLFFTGVAIPWLVKTGIPWLRNWTSPWTAQSVRWMAFLWRKPPARRTAKRN